MKLKLRTKAAIVLACFAIVVGAACGARAWYDAQEAEQERIAAEEAAAVEADIGDFKVSALDDEVVGMLGGGDAAEQLEKKVGAWCVDNVEEAEYAEWDQRAERDYRAGTVDLGFSLDDDDRTRIKVRVWPATGQYVVSKAVV